METTKRRKPLNYGWNTISETLEIFVDDDGSITHGTITIGNGKWKDEKPVYPYLKNKRYGGYDKLETLTRSNYSRYRDRINWMG